MPGLRQIELSFGGMTCAACAARLEKTLAAIPDVTAVVNFATEKASVAAPATVSVEQLVDVVRHSGYSAEATRPGLIAAPGAAMAASSAFVVASSVLLGLRGDNATPSTATGTAGPDQEACACPG